MQRKLRVVASVVSLTSAVVLAPAGIGHATDTEVTGPVLISGENALPPADTAGACGSDPAHQNWEQDNALAVNPVNGSNIVAAWMQDWADGIVVGHSINSGKTWRKSVPKTTRCTWQLAGQEPPGDFAKFNSVIDPWVTFGPSSGPGSPSIAYLTSVASSTEHPVAATLVNRSTDGGRTWSDPAVLDTADTTFPGGEYVDSSHVTADPVRPARAYAAWIKGNFTIAERSVHVASTDNGGRTWSIPRPINPTPGFLPVHGQLQALADGSLVAITPEIPQPTQYSFPAGHLVGPTSVVARRSHDGGDSWPERTVIGVADPSRAVTVQSAVAPDGTLYVAWTKLDDSGYNLMFSRSTDRGGSWTTPAPAGPPIADADGTGNNTAIATPNLAVADDGTVGMTFYDHRNDSGDSSELTTDLWFRHSHDGVDWTEDPIAGPFDKTVAPDGKKVENDFDGPGNIGDYQGIAPMAGGFASSFVLAKPLDNANFAPTHPPTDIFFARLRP